MSQRAYRRTVVVILAFLFIAFVIVLQGSLGLRPMTAQSTILPTPTPEPTGSITGTVFDDADRDGVYDTGEVGIGGVTVQVWQGTSLIDTMTTDSSGVYSVTLHLGTYTVKEIDPTGYTSTTPNEVDVTLDTDGQIVTVNFGDRGAGRITGVVYDDLDGSGTRDAGEPGLPDVYIEVREGGTPVFSNTTTSAGAFAFYDVWIGDYTVHETDPPNYRSTTSNTLDVSITFPGEAVAVAFGDRGVGTIDGVVFEDVNENWVRDPGEPGVGGVTVELYTGTDPVPDTRVTAGDGSYTFADLWVNEDYRVKKPSIPGYGDVTPNEINITLTTPGQEEAADFGVLAQATVEGTVFYDADQDGVRDPGESGLGGVQVRLTGPVNRTTNTAGDGTYSFEEVALGTYAVRETDPSGFGSTTPNSVTVLLNTPAQVEVVDFGDYGLPGEVHGTVFNDLDGDGVQGPGELGLSGVTVALRQGGGVVSTTTTGGDGAYSFPNVAPGAYIVRETDPAGYVSTTPNDVSVSVSPGGSAVANFGDRLQGLVSGVVYHDVNGDGVRNTGESGIGDVTVELLQGGSVLSTTTTGAGGVYSFTNILAGSYVVRETDPVGYVSTTPNEVAISLTTGGATVNFGDQQIGAVSGVVYTDLNGNGVRDTGESGIAGVTIELLQGGGVLSTTTTDGTGVYSFPNVPPDSYTVQETDPAGYVSTTPNAVAVSLAAGGSATANFGDQPQGTVSGVVFNDVDGNGVQDGGEGGIGGVTVRLYQGTSFSLTTTTDSSGVYSFTGVVSGTYTVASSRPAGFVNTTPEARTVVVSPNGSATANFGYRQMGTVGGAVFNDLNGNGIRDAGEPGIADVEITLTSAGGTFTTTTTVSGAYLFTDVAPGAATVASDPVPGFVRTTPGSVDVWLAAAGSASASFGFQGENTINGVAFNDVNGDGARGLGELGLPGVVITLTGASNTYTTTTLGNGSYSFGTVDTGVYVVEAGLPGGYVRTTPGWHLIVMTGGTSANVDFGYQVAGMVSGVAFDDLNGNGVRDTGEAGIGGVTISLVDGGTISTTTAGDGTYSFSGVASGSYAVEATAPAGFTHTTAGSVPINMVPGGVAFANFGFREQGTVSGFVFNDANGNGVRDAGETGIGGVQVELKGAAIETTLSAGDGSYSFADVEVGSYVVEVASLTGFAHTSPKLVSVYVAPGGSASASFGFQGAGTVSGVAFYDDNGNGVREPGEGGIGGIVISLVGNDTVTTTTLSNGSYSFSDVASGDYAVSAELPAGLARTTPGTVNVYVAPGGSAAASFGYRGIGTVSGVAFDDYDGDGVQDPGESGLGGVVISLVGTDTITTVTTGDGSYLFHDVAAGSYVVEAAAPTGFVHTTPGWVTVVVAPDGGASADFGFQAQDTVRGTLFRDDDGDGVQDPGESGIGGVEVTLTDGGTTETAYTAGNGTYSFDDVAAGTYDVATALPTGFARTTPGTVPVVVTAGGGAVANFGFQRMGSLNGVVFNDVNGNGVKDPGEPGIGGLTITTSGKWGITTTSSGADGSYLFPYLLPGAYTVGCETPTGFVPTMPNPVAVLIDPGSSASADFGFQGVGTVSGVAFNDANGNGVQDAGEVGLGGLVIELLTSGGTLTATTVGDGTYLFTDVPDGNHTVAAPDVAGFVHSTPSSVSVVILPGGAATANFGYQPVGTVSGVTFHDLNGNGARDAGEPGLGGVTLTLTPETGPDRTMTSLSDGSYAFANVLPGAYTVSAAEVTGFSRTTLGAVQVAVPAGGSAVANFGYRQAGTIGGFVFNDANGNGIRDAGENGLGGVVVAYDVYTTTTVANGAYLFTDVQPGTYAVASEDLLGFDRTTPSPLTVYVATGGSASADFGYRLARSVSGATFNDINGNGIFDAGEAGIGGVQITLTGDGTQTATTAGDGSYSFTELGAGTYDVAAADIAGYDRTTPATVQVTLGANDSASASFGYRRAGTVSGLVFQDYNGDGLPSLGEPGIGGVTVTLQSGGTDVLALITAQDGSYTFFDVAVGDYTVVETDPPGFVSTSPNVVAVTLSAQQTSASVNFGDIPEGRVYGVVFHDFDSDGAQALSEPGLGGVALQLYGGTGGTPVDTTQTVGNGLYSFDAAPGGYRVHETNPSGFVSTTPDWVEVTLASAASVNANFGDKTGALIFTPLTMRKFPAVHYLPLVMRAHTQ
jgi:hypothetical protein